MIAGDWVEGGETTRNLNPSNTNDVIGEYARASAANVARAIAAAKAASHGWAVSLDDRELKIERMTY